jgi:hypothetical protein
LIAETLSERQFKILFYRTLPPNGGPLIHFFKRIVELKVTIVQVRIEQCVDEDDDFIVFETNLVDSAGNPGIRNNSSCACEVPMRTVILFLAGLDYRMVSGKANYSSLAVIPDHIRDFFQKSMAEGRMLSGAELIANGERIRFSFGRRDAAVSEYI